MARLGNRLTAAFVGKVTEPGMYADGHGLYLQVGPTGGRHWVYRYRRGGKNTDMGLGPLHTVSLADARKKALGCRQQRLDGLDPLTEKRRTQQPLRDTVTFEWCALQYLRAHSVGWKDGGKSAAQWEASLKAYVYPIFGRFPVQEIDKKLVMRVLDPIWTEKTPTASRVRQRIEAILDWATAREYRTGENPAGWSGNIEHLLASPTRARPTEHHAAMMLDDIPAFLEKLRARGAVSARAIELLVYTAARTGEIIGAGWDEIERDGQGRPQTWVIPADRRKGKKGESAELRIPLSSQAIAVIEHMSEVRQSEYVFPGQAGGPLRASTMRMMLHYLGHDDLTIHGYRAAFRTWAAERTNFPAEVAEAALGHKVSEKVVAAYQRGDFFDRRRRMMQAWAEFVTKPIAQPSGKVVAIGGRRG